jgi:hypothetical protein
VHSGAAFVAEANQSVLVGNSPACDLVLMDTGVKAQSLRLFEQNGALVAEVSDTAILHDGGVLATGLKAFSQRHARLRVGSADIDVELLSVPQRRPSRPEGDARRRANASAFTKQKPQRSWVSFTLVVASIAAVLGVVGGAVNASSGLHYRPIEASRSVGSVVDAFNARGAQIEVAADAEKKALLRGTVTDAAMRRELERELTASGLNPGLQLHEVQQMAESLTRLARLTGYVCETRHLGEGRFACDAEVPDAQAVDRLSALAAQVPGVQSLAATPRQIDPPVVEPEPVAPPVAVAPPPPPVRPSVPFPVISHVLIGDSRSMAIDADGRTLRVGDQVEGAKVVAIRFDSVELEFGRQRYKVGVATQTSAAGLATNPR